MKKFPRQWFKITENLVLCIDFTVRSPVATIEAIMHPDTTGSWTPESDAQTSIIRAQVGSRKREFTFDPDNKEKSYQALMGAVKWCTDVLGPPITIVTKFEFIIRCLMFWRYKLLCKGFKIVGIVSRSHDRDYQKQIEEEWASIKRGFNKDDASSDS